MKFRIAKKKRQLFPHQEEGFHFGLKRKHFGLLLEMRLGKSLTAIRIIQAKKNILRCLVVAPLTVLKTWEEELKQEGEEFVIGYGLSKIKRERLFDSLWEKELDRRVWVLINYESLLALGPVEKTYDEAGNVIKRNRWMPKEAFLPWDVMILDESTKISNPKAQITKIVTNGFRKVRHRIILTGLIAPENDLQVFSQMKFLFGNFMGYKDYYRFQNDIFFQNWQGEWVTSVKDKTSIKEELHKLCFIKTRKEAGMGVEPIIEERYVEMTPKQKALYKKIEKEYAYAIEEYLGQQEAERLAELSGEEYIPDNAVETQYIIVRNLWLRKLTGGFDPENNLLSDKKMKELLTLLKGDLSGQKVVIWCAFRHEVEYISSQLFAARFSPERIMGGTKLWERKKSLETFRKSRRCNQLVATVDCAKFGVDISHASTAIYYSQVYSCEARNQSKDRLVHPNKTETPLILDLVIPKTIEEDMVVLGKNKIFNAKMLMRKIERNIWERNMHGKN